MIFQHFDRDEFLRDYWQKQPLLIRNPGQRFKDLVTAEELAGLACEESVESRLVSTQADGNLKLAHGPFAENEFKGLGERDWTLLVQAVDQYVGAVDGIKSWFDFIPRWRIDDVMVSYACPGGGVGAHFDQYDVFLIQGSGSRNWKIGAHCNASSPLRANTDLRILANFEAESEYILEPGDMLYLPPRIAHHGVSIDHSLCYSVGFRSPSLAEIIQGYTDDLCDTVSEDLRFVDPAPTVPSYPDEVSQPALLAGFSMLENTLGNQDLFNRWFASYVTNPKYPEHIEPTSPAINAAGIANLINKQGQLTEFNRNPSSRFAYYMDGNAVGFFVDGHPVDCSIDQIKLVRQLCECSWTQAIPATELPADLATAKLLATLVNQGSLLLCSIDDG